MSIWLDRLGIVIGVAEIVASDGSTNKDVDDAKAALATLDRGLNDKTATMPAAGGPAGAVRSLHLLIVECLANQRDVPSRSRLRAATALTKEKWDLSADSKTQRAQHVSGRGRTAASAAAGRNPETPIPRAATR